ncbi:MAG: hypothetical protein HYX92_15165 [Chloroflexi bacterium]|nr:hypothetical protein [Chloroflexota bacterium]
MARYMWLVEQESSDPAREQEFEEWLDKYHLPSLLDAPGVVSATWYVNEGPKVDGLQVVPSHGRNAAPATGWAKGQAKNVAVYEIETDDLEKTWMELYTWVTEQQKKAGWRHSLLNVVRRSVWRQATPKKRAKK